MRWTAMAGLFLVLMAGTARGQDVSLGQPQPPPPTTLPSNGYGGLTLREALEQIRAIDPHFNYTIVTRNGANPDGPVLPRMEATGITVDDFMQFLELGCLRGVAVQPVGSTGDRVFMYVILIDGSVEQSNTEVRVFPLGSAVDSTAADASDNARINAMNNILSLLQAAVQATGDTTPYKMRVHEPTLTLIFAGDQREEKAIQDAVDAVSEPRQDLSIKVLQLEDKLAESQATTQP
ncbi:MAG TPA: hypothetical protein VMD30_07840 [Tepidisphaeraceae bacterium]|nr:hypothetical protein [Tepidisphaeraceae bacterium]